jgi:pyruvate carboxylase
MLDVPRLRTLNDSVRMLSDSKYRNDGTVDLLEYKNENHFFMAVNPRVQIVCLTEENTRSDIAQNQIMILSGRSLEELGLVQHKIPIPNGVEMKASVVFSSQRFA